MAILPVGISAEEGSFKIERSLRFNSADSAYLNRTPASAGSRTTMTFSAWLKLANLSSGTNQWIWGAVDDNYGLAQGTANDLRLYFSGTSYIITSAVFRDPSAWYHIVAAIDTTDATPSNRLKLYVNGIQQTIGSSSYPSSGSTGSLNNNVVHNIGRAANATRYWSGYMAEVHFIDGQALTPSSFGETDTDTGVWKPKAYSGSYGTNGFYLDFADNSSTTALGYDAAGSNDWTPNNFSVTAGAGNDSLVDSPTRYGTDTGVGGEVRGNYATLNPIADGSYFASGQTLLSFSNGNLNYGTAGRNAFGTIAVSSGKWYYEMVNTSNTASAVTLFGLVTVAARASVYGVYYNSSNGNKGLGTLNSGASETSYGATWTDNDVIGVALDMDAATPTVTFYKNGSSQGSISVSSFAGQSVLTWIQNGANSGNMAGYVNFGQRPFSYTAPSGFKALCTTNLPEPTIAEGKDYFNAVLYTGNGSTNNITGVGFQPDFVWLKIRNAANNHALYDSVRGVRNLLKSSATDPEFSDSAGYGLTAFNSDGFSLGADTATSASTNPNTYLMASWNWKANGAGVSNTAGTISSTVSANTTAGFAIATTSGTGGAGTIGHGLGVVPQFIMCFRRNTSADHYCYHQAIGNTDYLVLNTTAAKATSSNMWNNTTPTSTVFSVGNTNNNSGDTYVHYIFAPIAGYSAFGSFVGNGSSEGPFVYCGFRPRFVFYKRTDSTGPWVEYDTARNSYNLADTRLELNSSAAEVAASTSRSMDILSNGFKLRGASVDTNASGGTYIYAAFAENPFKFSLAR